MSEFYISSEDFKEGEEIPKYCGYKHGNTAPLIAVGNFPRKTVRTEGVALIMDDPDAMGAVGKVWVHWVIWNMLNYDGPLSTGRICTLGTNSFGELGYGGPAPPDKMHTYVFKLYALDSELDLPDKSTKADVEKAMEGHIIEQTQLTGTYAP